MKNILLLQLANPEELLDQLTLVYERLREVATASNDLRSFISAELMIASIERGGHMLKMWRENATARPSKKLYYSWEPYICQIEETDTVEALLQERFTFVHNGAFA